MLLRPCSTLDVGQPILSRPLPEYVCPSLKQYADLMENSCVCVWCVLKKRTPVVQTSKRAVMWKFCLVTGVDGHLNRATLSSSRIRNCTPPGRDISLDWVCDSLARAPVRVGLAKLTPALRVYAIGHGVPLCCVRLRRLLRSIVASRAFSWFVPLPWL